MNLWQGLAIGFLAGSLFVMFVLPWLHDKFSRQRAKWRPYPSVWKEAQAEGWSAKKKTQVSDYDHFCKDCL